MNRIVLVLSAVVAINSTIQAAEHTKDTPQMVNKALEEKKAILLDVREKSEWEEGHLRDATSLPLSKLKKEIETLDLAKLLPKDKIIYAHCRAGVRCLQAADLLKKAGYDVRPLKPGYKDLIEAGLPKAK